MILNFRNLFLAPILPAATSAAAETKTLFQTVDLDIGESREVAGVTVKLLKVRESKGKVWGQVDRAEIDIVIGTEVDRYTQKQIETIQTTMLQGQIRELDAQIKGLEGQVASLDSQISSAQKRKKQASSLYPTIVKRISN